MHATATTLLLALAALGLAGPDAANAQTNVALGGVASQSSTAYDGAAGRAIDGNSNGSYPGGSVTHTDAEIDSDPEWAVDLGQDHQIDEIVIWNRTDCCAGRLYDFSVEVVTDSNLVVPIGRYASAPTTEFRPGLPAGGVIGRIVRIRLELDPGNLDTRTLSLAEVQVFGAALSDPPVEPPMEPPSGGLPVGRSLRLSGSSVQKMKTTWDGPAKTVDLVLDLLRDSGLDLEEVPYQCSWSTAGISLARIRFDGAPDHRFELIDAGGNRVTGSYKQKGPGGERVKLKVDPASEKSLKRMLLKASLECTGLEDGEDPDETLLKQRVRLKRAVLKGRIEDDSTFFLSIKLKGSVKWKKKNPQIGKFYGSGTATAKFEVSAPLSQTGLSLPDECRADGLQGQHIYPTPGAQFEGWIELTEIRDSDRYYLILSDAFVSILQDFEEDFQSVAALLAIAEATGEECVGDPRIRLAIELTEFGKDNFVAFLDLLKDIEIQITLFIEYIEQAALELFFDAVFGGSPVGELADEYSKYIVVDVIGIPIPDGDDIIDAL